MLPNYMQAKNSINSADNESQQLSRKNHLNIIYNLANYHAIFDAVGQDNVSRFVKHLKENGHIVSIQDRIDKPLVPLFTATTSIMRSRWGYYMITEKLRCCSRQTYYCFRARKIHQYRPVL
jgi:NADPH:quinone reductase-like Zn-dependent oxidoreductase